MESSIGYSEGVGTKIATHTINDGSGVQHVQKISTGSGTLELQQIVAPTTGGTASSMINCVGAGYIVIAPLVSITGCTFMVFFYDANRMVIGNSEDIAVGAVSTMPPFIEVPDTWTATTDYSRLSLLAIGNNIYQQVQTSSGTYIGGTSGGTEPTWPTNGTTVSDGTCVWQDFGLHSTLLSVPMVIFSNSIGATYFHMETTSIAGTMSFWADSV